MTFPNLNHWFQKYLYLLCDIISLKGGIDL
nr:MAG TPA: hypothetical protein [Caudoviricetes sp.]